MLNQSVAKSDGYNVISVIMFIEDTSAVYYVDGISDSDVKL